MQKKYSGISVLEIKQKLSHFCAYQDRSHYEVEKKLKEFHLIPEAKNEILMYLIQNRFLNEERFAKSYVRGKFYQKKWGRNKIIFELKKRKINTTLINIGLEEIEQKDYFETLKNLIEEKEKTYQKEKRFKKNYKVQQYLIQKGYEYDLIKELQNLEPSQ